jgi:pilus assembly protein CpaE
MKASRILVLDGSDALGEQVERAVKGMRPRPDVVRHGIEEIAALIAGGGPALDVIIAGPSFATDAGLVQLRALRLHIPQTALVLAFDKLQPASLRQTVQVGAVDILRLPVQDSVIADALRHALAETRGDRPADDAARPAPDRKGEVIAVLSATGGSGKTFLAANLAYYLESRQAKRTCLIDLDLQFGELESALRLRPRSTIKELLAGGGDVAELAARLPDHLVAHDTGIHVLAAPETPNDAAAITPKDIANVLAAACTRFDYVIVDTPANLTEPVLVALEMATHFYAVATLDLPSVRNLGVLLTTLRRLNVSTEHVHLMLNKVEPDVGIELRQVSRYFPGGFSIVVPYGREASRALNMGTPILAYAPHSDVSRRLCEGFAATLRAGDEAAAAPSLARRLTRTLSARAASGRST